MADLEPNETEIFKTFKDFIIKQDHPCMMAQTVFSQDAVEIKKYEGFGTLETAEKIYSDLKKYLKNYDFESNDFRTFMAVFPKNELNSEAEYEKILWEQLSKISKVDEEPWDPTVSSDITDKNFSFSIAGKAFYIVGMHPKSSRFARRAPYPSIAFNLHWQFEKLREMGAYETVRDRIRERDKELQGFINPMLKDFGKSSEAKQYSGRAVKKDWVCPFHK
ncbi:guanitoxin biosynthesis heme-dependent pre-guanitoxin N-hydroxylase GntA [Christiangramia antarctica]|uniref:Guanitoxin biosynthesis heme-dependent pre-guanitoxin N-hydroxylase GntA n=2 Tax=Christiangramia TaxID=292691 RepID=A0ABW5X1J6_9FLAO